MTGRRIGAPRRLTCCGCGVVEATMRGWPYRCDACGPSPRRSLTNATGKAAAHGAVAKAIDAGQLAHPRGMACVDCGGEAIEYEHRDYNKPLCVDPVCRRCNLARGPAVPLAGGYQRLVEAGRAPLVLKKAVEKLFRHMGADVHILEPLPKKLNAAHWTQLLPVLTAAERRAGE